MNPFEKVEGVAKVKDLEEMVFRRVSESASKIPYFKDKLVTARRRERVRVETLARELEKYLNSLLKIVNSLMTADRFYREFALIFYSENEVLRAKRRILNSIRIVKSLKKQYLRLISRCRDEFRLADIRKEALGRMISVLKRGSREFELVRDLWIKLRKLPSIDKKTPTIVIAGPPNVGKSSLVRAISTARVEVASYPFTTKDISVGHFLKDNLRFQVIDTPGLLDRPMSERNPIERKSILCLKNASDLIVFLFDVSPEKYYAIEKQISVYSEIKGLFNDKEVIPVINKIDAAIKEDVKQVYKALGEDVLKISVKEKLGLNELIDLIVEKLGCKSRSFNP